MNRTDVETLCPSFGSFAKFAQADAAQLARLPEFSLKTVTRLRPRLSCSDARHGGRRSPSYRCSYVYISSATVPTSPPVVPVRPNLAAAEVVAA
ncbi:hypothetical protein EDB85DRAFT_2140485 [Lactarius pseudohatsudake]|nr:hypothetical protein EDB85DRAFT_2140485 [Lactarius pseudohatsudake]